MTKLFNKMLNFVGLDTEEEDINELESKNNTESLLSNYSQKKNKVVNMPTFAQVKVVVMQPDVFDDASIICDHLKGKKPVVINLESAEKDVARRIVDFLSGSVYALDGTIQKVSNSIFIVAPHNVDVMGEFKDELRTKGVFPWAK
ncbi:MAG: cell division protein SepF [Deltaproteobacteria bacterium]